MNKSEYMELTLQTLRNEIKPGDKYLTAAALGMSLRRQSPHVTWRDFGKRSLSDLLDDPWFSCHLKKTSTEKDALAVALVDGQANGEANPEVEQFNPLRKAMWEAFILASPTGRRFVSRMDGSTRLGMSITPSPADDWIEITPIDIDKQHEWACQFSENHKSEISKPPDRQDWTNSSFTAYLKKHHENLVPAWNRFRSAKVSHVVREFLVDNGLSIDFGFQSKGSRGDVSQFIKRIPEQFGSPTKDTKGVLLSALSMMPIEALLEIPIPARYIFDALSKNSIR